MRKLDINIKLRVIKLFLNGYTLDEIAEQLDIAKGSVVNNINYLRGGKSIPPFYEIITGIVFGGQVTCVYIATPFPMRRPGTDTPSRVGAPFI